MLDLLNWRAMRREGERWIDPPPPGPADGREPEVIPGGPSRLVVSHDPAAIDGDGRPRSAILRTMLAAALCALTGEPDERGAWTSLLPSLRPGHVVGLKLNTVAVHLVPHRAVVDALVASLGTVGVAPEHIVIWDNLGRLGPVRMRLYGDVDRPEGAYYQGMARAGYAPNSEIRPQILCTLPRTVGVGYDRKVLAHIPSRRLSLPVTRLLTQVCDHVINLPVPKDHRVTGMTCALKNFYGCVPLWDAFRPTNGDLMHADRGDPQIAELYANECIHGKVRLHVCDALRAICDGGPWGRPQLEPRSFLLATDPVAMDAYVLAMIDGARRERGMEHISRRARYLESAARLQLGTNDPESIELLAPTGSRIAWSEPDAPSARR